MGLSSMTVCYNDATYYILLWKISLMVFHNNISIAHKWLADWLYAYLDSVSSWLSASFGGTHWCFTVESPSKWRDWTTLCLWVHSRFIAFSPNQNLFMCTACVCACVTLLCVAVNSFYPMSFRTVKVILYWANELALNSQSYTTPRWKV